MKVLLILVLAVRLSAQLPTRAAIAGSNLDEAAIERGGALFAAQCARCHGPAGRGTNPQTDLIRANRVRTGEAVVHANAGLTKPQIDDLQVWLKLLLFSVSSKGNQDFLNILTGDPGRGEKFFIANCATCHSTRGDLAGIGGKYDPSVLQSLWLNPRRSRTPRTVTVTPPGITGTLDRIDEFLLVLKNPRREIPLTDESKVEIKDPLQPHYDLYLRLTDADIHNVTAFLATLK
jgi:cytochrome c oxidase cbb3-type subunit 3